MLKLALVLLALPAAAQAAPVTAARTLPTGTVLSEGDLVVAGDPADMAALDALVGMETRVMIYEGKPVTASQIGAPTLVERNQMVTLTYLSDSLQIETEGRALSAGRLGETVRVMNLGSRTTVTGEVAANGAVVIRRR